MSTTTYLVSWLIEIEEEDTPRGAAEAASFSLHHTSRLSDIFTVRDSETGETTTVELPL